MSRAIDLSNKKSYVLVKFTYGPFAAGDPNFSDGPTKAAYTNWSSDISGNPDFVSTPNMEVVLPENSGTLDEKAVKIKLPRDPFTNLISSGVPMSPLFAEIWEKTLPINPGDSVTSLKVFSGRVYLATRNPNGKREVVEISSFHPKSKLKVSLSFPANHQCCWIFGEGECQLARHSKVADIVSIDDKTITVDDMGGAGAPPHFGIDRFYHRGFIEKSGVRIGIRDWRIASPNEFHLVKRPPSAWTGGTVAIYEGCDKTIESCRSRHSLSGEQYFMGTGYAIPDHNPLYEEG